MGVKHHRKIYINCATAYINKNHRIPIRAADRTRSEQDSTYLPLSLLRTALQKKKKLNDLDSGVGNDQKNHPTKHKN